MNWPWSELGLPGPCGPDEVKHAYAQCLKTTHPEEDPEGFQRLHDAYQTARRLARNYRPALEEEAGQAEEEHGGYAQPPVQESGDCNIPPLKKEAGEVFDYESLFAEGDQEKEEARRRRVEERLRAARARREADARIRQDAALASEEAWSAAFAALHAVEVLYTAGLPVEAWVRFLHSSTFLDAQHNLDFVFGLEDFLTEHDWIPDEIKRKIFLAYGFYRGKPQTVYLGLYRLLLASYRDAGRANRNIERALWRQRKPYVILTAVMGVLILLTLISNSLPRSDTGKTGSADTAYSVDSPVPDQSSQPSAAEGNIPLEGGDDVTTFHSLVTAYAAGDFPGPYAITGKGTAENELGTFQWMQCSGKDANWEDLVMNYYLSSDNTSLYCIPEEKSGETVEMECIKTWRGISIYRCVEE